MMHLACGWWSGNGLTFMVGSFCLSAIGVVFALVFRAPILRQRICEAVAAGTLVWLAFGLMVPLLPADMRRPVTTVAGLPLAIAEGPQGALPANAALGLAWMDWVGLILLAGACAFTTYILVAHLLLRRLLASARPADRGIQLFTAALPLALPSTRVLISRQASRPFCCGLRHPKIVLPESCHGEPADSLRSVLMHEVAHLSQGDLRGRALFALSLPVMFWNPLFWWLRSQAQLCAELVADDVAAQHLHKPTYVRQLITLAERSPSSRHRGAARLAAFGKESEFYRRMKMLMQRNDPISSRCSFAQTALRRLCVLSLVALAACAWSDVPESNPDASADASDSNIVGTMDVAPEDAPRVYFNFQDTDVTKVMDTIAKISGSNIVMSPDVKGKVTLRFKNVPWQNAMVEAARQVGCVVRRMDRNIYRVTKGSD